ncbi:MAG TPA: site-specific integrase, partial [Bacteroidales bacterium]
MIALRYKKMASGKYSIYLDRYNEATRKRSYCFLKLHVTKNYSGNKKVAPQDEKTMLAAMVELQKASFEFNDSCKTGEKSVSTEDGAITLISFLEKQCFQPSSNNMALLKQTKDFLKGKDIVLDRINTKWLDKFKSYMSERLSDTTVSTRLMLFRTHLNRALKQGLLKRNLFESYPLKKGTPKNRQFLTDKELNQLIHTPTTFNPQIRGAFLFACYSGLRWDDVENLKQLQVSE